MHGLSARLCSVPCRYTAGFMPCQSALSALALSAHRLHARPPLPLYAGVEPAHTRICSAFSCDVFARVVWIKRCGSDRLYFFALPAARTHLPRMLPATQSRMRKEFKRGIPSSFCPFRTFRTGEKYLVLHVLLHDQKCQKSSKRFPLRNLPVSSRFAKARTIHTLLCEHIE